MTPWIWATAVAAAPFEVGPVVDGPHEGLQVVAYHDGHVLLRLTSTTIEVAQGPPTPSGGASAVVVTDVDGDGSRDLVRCAAEGLVVDPWEGPTAPAPLTDVPCRALVALRGTEPLLLAVESDEVRLWALSPARDLGAVFAAPHDPIVAVHGASALVADATATTHHELGPRGQRALSTTAAPVAASGGWIWVVDGRLEGLEEAPMTFPGISAVRRADLDGDGLDDLVVAHEASSLIGVVGLREERSVPVALTPRHVATGDLDGDGRDEVVVGDGQQWIVLSPGELPPRLPSLTAPVTAATATPDPDPIEAPPDVRETTPSILDHGEWPTELRLEHHRFIGMRIPTFAGTGGTLASGRAPSDLSAFGSLGISMGSTMFAGRGIGGFLAFAGGLEGHTPLGRLWFGMDSSPLLFNAGQSVSWHIAYLSAGTTLGSPHVRTGPFGSLGIIGLASGWRFVITPFETPSGAVHGLEARVGANFGFEFEPPEGEDPGILWREPLGEVLLMYTGVFQLGRTSKRWDPRLPDPISADVRQGPGIRRRLGLAAGWAVGASSTRLSWEFIATDQQVEVSASPAVALSCETGARTVRWVGGLESAPVFTYRVPWDQQGSDQLAPHLLSGTIGTSIGSDAIRVGPIATAGVWTLGAGARVSATPIVGPRGVRHGLELRGLALWPSVPAVETMILYTAAMDPRKGVRDGT